MRCSQCPDAPSPIERDIPRLPANPQDTARPTREFQNEPDLASLDELFSALEEFKKHDKDCNFDQIFRELLNFLDELANKD